MKSLKKTMWIFYFFLCTVQGNAQNGEYIINTQSLDELRHSVDLFIDSKKLTKQEVKAVIDLADSLKNHSNEQSLLYIKKVLPHTQYLDDNKYREISAIISR